MISPTLANLTLDGLERLLKDTFRIRQIHGTVHNPRVNFVRYADDFIITGSSKDLLENEVKPLVERFMLERGLQLSPEKTCITHIEQGFDLLGQNLRKYGGKLLITPSAKMPLSPHRTQWPASPGNIRSGQAAQAQPSHDGSKSAHASEGQAQTPLGRLDHKIPLDVWSLSAADSAVQLSCFRPASACRTPDREVCQRELQPSRALGPVNPGTYLQ